MAEGKNFVSALALRFRCHFGDALRIIVFGDLNARRSGVCKKLQCNVMRIAVPCRMAADGRVAGLPVFAQNKIPYKLLLVRDLNDVVTLALFG